MKMKGICIHRGAREDEKKRSEREREKRKETEGEQ
jgi:hypothetical protein